MERLKEDKYPVTMRTEDRPYTSQSWSRTSTGRLMSVTSVEESTFTSASQPFGIEERRETQMAKMLAVILVPIITLIVLTTLALVVAVNVQTDALESVKEVNEYLRVDSLVTSLQIERGTAVAYLSSNGSNTDAYTSILGFWRSTSRAVNELTLWPEGGMIVGDRRRTTANKEDLVRTLEDFRKQVKELNTDVEETIQFYTQIDTALMDWADSQVTLPEDGHMWPKVVTASSMLRASDSIGVERALGSVFYTLCEFNVKRFEWFMSLQGESSALLSFTFSHYPKSEQAYQSSYVGSTLEMDIEKMKEDMLSLSYTDDCLKTSQTVRFKSSQDWFENMTSYMQLLKGFRAVVNDDILSDLANVMQDTKMQVSIYSVVTVIVTILSIVISVWYTARIHEMTEKVRLYGKKISLKTLQLMAEKRKTDLLLHQLLPKAVADQLKLKKEVPPEYYDNVTIYFSDIVGFTSISAKSSPLQVVDLLNSLYSMFDASIDRYKVYKVETIGDAYMVASGLPERTSNHTSEIANLSLELLQSASDFHIPHLPNDPLRLRVGLHTGACVAGVVGLKMPRYCLFGETVNMASKMESTSEPQMIHISSTTKTGLDAIGGYVVQNRGEMSLQEGAVMQTFWLIGKSGPHTANGVEKKLHFNLPDISV